MGLPFVRLLFMRAFLRYLKFWNQDCFIPKHTLELQGSTIYYYAKVKSCINPAK
jgi:hypothetical protein